MTISPKAAAYNHRVYSPEEYRRSQSLEHLDFQPALHVGQKAPEFTATDLQGKPVCLSDFRGRNIVFEFGCITAPVFINDLSDLHRLQGKFSRDDIEIFVIYNREAHAAEHYPAHASLEQKIEHARDLKRMEQVELRILVDSLEGDAHQTYGMRPSPVWGVNREGLVFYKATWLIADELEQQLQHLLRAEKWHADDLRTRKVYSESWTDLWINQDVHARVLDRAGPSARKEVAHAHGVDPVTHGRKT